MCVCNGRIFWHSLYKCDFKIIPIRDSFVDPYLESQEW